jgi:hypothetical protein
VKPIIILISLLFSLKTFAYQCPIDPKLSEAEQEEFCRKGGEEYSRWQLEMQKGYEGNQKKEKDQIAGPGTVRCAAMPYKDANGKIIDICNNPSPHHPTEPTKVEAEPTLLGLMRAEAEIQYLYDYNCEKKSSFPACEQYKHYLRETSKHAVDAACKRSEVCIRQYHLELSELKGYNDSRNAAGLRLLIANYPTVFLNPREVADESHAYDEVVRQAPAFSVIAEDKHEKMGSDHVACEEFTRAFLKTKKTNLYAMDAK